MNTMNLPWVESPFFKDILKEKQLSDEHKRIATEYNENGFIVLSGIIPQTLIDDVQKDSEEMGFNQDFPIKTHRDANRVQDLWTVSNNSRQLACFPQVLEILEMLYGRETVPFQTLNFKVGTQQKAHSDTVHFSSLPAKYMCGVWVALEDITPENGAVYYYPKSQRLPEYDFSSFKDGVNDSSYDDYSEYEVFIESLMKQYDIEKKCFYAKKGDILIWSSNIIHGGSPLLNKDSTRWSQVTHYYFKDCIYYTPMLSNMVTNELFLRDKLINIRTNEPVKQSFNGEDVKFIKMINGKHIINKRMKEPNVLFKFVGSLIYRHFTNKNSP